MPNISKFWWYLVIFGCFMLFFSKNNNFDEFKNVTLFMTAFYVILLFSLWKLVRILICFLLASTSLPHFFSLSINSLFVRHSSRWCFARHSQGFLNQSSLSSVFIVDDSAAITGNCGTSHFPKTDNFVRKKIDFCDIHARSGQRFWKTDFFRPLFYNS